MKSTLNPRYFLKLLLLWLLCLSSTYSFQVPKNHFPQAIMQLDSYFSHHIILAEKSTHKLYLFRNNNGLPELVKVYQMATGKKAGDKIFQGDHRTPEGVYFLKDFLTHKDLIDRHGKQGEIYGVGAFVLNYPNPIDSRKGKTGGGIWLHSTNDETRIDKGLDSRGCIVTANTHLIDIAKYIELNRTSLVVVHDLPWLNEMAWKQKRDNIKKTVSTWIQAWQSEDFKTYISSYHKEFQDPIRGNLTQFKIYKKAVFNQPGSPQISIDSTSILQGREYAVVTFRQAYTSKTIQDLGRKTLYLKRDEFYNWKIVAEAWSKAGISTDTNEKVSFRPSMRFFKTSNPAQILGDTLLSKRTENSQENSSNN